MRYRVGDVYRCVGLENQEDETHIPRFQYIDRIPTIIDIAGTYLKYTLRCSRKISRVTAWLTKDCGDIST